MAPQIAVVGAGVVGLSTAVCVQNSLPNASVTIIADKFGADTTSHGAGGIFRPTPGKTPGVPMHLLKQWLHDSWQRYHSLAHSPDASESGVQVLSGYRFFNDPTVSNGVLCLAKPSQVLINELEKDLVYCCRPLTEMELKMFPGPAKKYKHGRFVSTILADGRKYMAYLTTKFRLNDGKLINKKLSSFAELVGQYDVVVNCTGLGSRELLGDDQLVPIRGQVFKVRAPWIKHSLHLGDTGSYYIIPGRDLVTVGGTRQDYDENTNVREEDAKKIWQEMCQAMPSLTNAEVVSQWAGLRPHRKPLRLEADTLSFPTGKLRVVHNYGHGAEGVSLSWGTACHATRLVMQNLVSASSKM